MSQTEMSNDLRSEELTRAVYDFTAKFIKGRVVENADEAIRLKIADVDASGFVTPRDMKLCRLRLAEASDRQLQARSEKYSSGL